MYTPLRGVGGEYKAVVAAIKVSLVLTNPRSDATFFLIGRTHPGVPFGRVLFSMEGIAARSLNKGTYDLTPLNPLPDTTTVDSSDGLRFQGLQFRV